MDELLIEKKKIMLYDRIVVQEGCKKGKHKKGNEEETKWQEEKKKSRRKSLS